MLVVFLKNKDDSTIIMYKPLANQSPKTTVVDKQYKINIATETQKLKKICETLETLLSVKTTRVLQLHWKWKTAIVKMSVKIFPSEKEESYVETQHV